MHLAPCLVLHLPHLRGQEQDGSSWPLFVAGQWHASPCVPQVRAQEGADLELSSGGCVRHNSCLHPHLPPLLPVPLPGGLCSGRSHDEHSQSLYVPQLGLGWEGCKPAPGLTPFLAPCSDGVDISPGPPLDDDLERLGLQLRAHPDRLCGLRCAQLEDAAAGCLCPLLPLLWIFMVGAAAASLKEAPPTLVGAVNVRDSPVSADRGLRSSGGQDHLGLKGATGACDAPTAQAQTPPAPTNSPSTSQVPSSCGPGANWGHCPCSLLRGSC